MFMDPLIIILDESIVPIKQEIKYYRFTIDKYLGFGRHVHAVCNKTNKTMMVLKRLCARIDGRSQNKCVLLAQSVVQYAAPVWTATSKYKKYEAKLI